MENYFGLMKIILFVKKIFYWVILLSLCMEILELSANRLKNLLNKKFPYNFFRNSNIFLLLICNFWRKSKTSKLLKYSVHKKLMLINHKYPTNLNHPFKLSFYWLIKNCSGIKLNKKNILKQSLVWLVKA